MVPAATVSQSIMESDVRSRDQLDRGGSSNSLSTDFLTSLSTEDDNMQHVVLRRSGELRVEDGNSVYTTADESGWDYEMEDTTEQKNRFRKMTSNIPVVSWHAMTHKRSKIAHLVHSKSRIAFNTQNISCNCNTSMEHRWLGQE